MTRSVVLIVFGVLIGPPPAGAAQTDDPLFRRWVGSQPPYSVALFLDFHGDSMLVVNDRQVLDFWYGPDSIIAYNADTSFAVRYQFSYDKLLLHTADGYTITMSPQSIAARPMFSGNGFAYGTWAASAPDGEIQLQLRRIGGVARWRKVPGGQWVSGSWDRAGRTITFTWDTGEEEEPAGGTEEEADSSAIWVGFYDAEGHQMIFDRTEPGSGVAIFRRVLRRED